jgi:hypothetical protein
MAFWIGIAVTAASLIISFVWTQKTLPIRLALLVLGLIGVGFAADRYFEEQQKTQQTLDYWEISRLNAFGLHFIGGDLEDHTELNNIIGPYIHRQNGNAEAAWDCTPASIDAYTHAIKFDNKFPFPYFYRGTCGKANNADDWHGDITTAQTLFRATTQIPGHNPDHDATLKMIEKGDLGRPSG